jgi:hypothetical protein
VQRKAWTKLVNRQCSAKSKQIWTPDANSVVCSDHFIDGRPTICNPFPTLKLGYKLFDKPSTRKPPKSDTSQPTLTEIEHVKLIKPVFGMEASATQDILANTTQSPSNHSLGESTSKVVSFPKVKEEQREVDVSSSLVTPDKDVTSCICHCGDTNLADVKKELRNTKARYAARSLQLNAKTKELAKLSQPTHKRLLKNNKKCMFYTGIADLEVFYALTEYIHGITITKRPVVKKTISSVLQLKYKKTKPVRNYKSVLSTPDRVLLTLMRLRLGLLMEDLCDR